MLSFKWKRSLTLGTALIVGMMGVAWAGTVNVYCDCDPDIAISGGGNYCSCQEHQALDAWATNEYRRRCEPYTYHYNLIPRSDLDLDVGPKTLVSNIPSGVTCTIPEGVPTSDGSNPYIYNDCTNWNFSKRSFDIDTYCTDIDL